MLSATFLQDMVGSSIVQEMLASYRALVLVYAFIFVLHRVLPARTVTGYCCDSDGVALQYRLNGFFVHVVTIGLFYLLYEGVTVGEVRLKKTTFYENYTGAALTASLLGIALSVWFYARGYASAQEEEYCSHPRCMTVDQRVKYKYINTPSFTSAGTRRSPPRQQVRSKSRGKSRSGSIGRRPKSASAPRESKTSTNTTQPASASALNRLLLGTEWNPRVLGVDIKMFLYIVGATYLQLNICSALEVQRLQPGRDGVPSLALSTYAALFTWFLCEYLLCEEVHLYTYDLFAEKVGGKLVWGCCFFYPFFYCVGMHCLVSAPVKRDISAWQCVLISALYLAGWAITRGANLQKYFYKRYPERKTFLFGFIEQKSLPKQPKILVSGFWGIARHSNYFGEIVQAFALALPGVLIAEGPWFSWEVVVPLLYPLYYVALFVPRQWDDDELCAGKYGDECWNQYKAMVPHRICPGVW